MAYIDSRLIFKILKHYTQRTDSHIFRNLCLEPSSSGRRFKEGLNGKSWWPKHSDWYYAMVDGSKQHDKTFYCESQPFPLDVSQESLIHIVHQENVKDIQRYGTDSLRFSLTKAKKQLTFESVLYNELMFVFKNQGYEDLSEVLFSIAKIGQAMEINHNALEQLLMSKDLDSLSRHLVLQGKEAAGTPFSQDNTDQLPTSDSLPMSLQELSEQMDRLVYKMETIQSKIDQASASNNSIWERIYQQQLSVHIQAQEMLCLQLEELRTRYKHCQDSCYDLRRDVRIFVDNNTYAADQRSSCASTHSHYITPKPNEFKLVPSISSEMIILQQRMDSVMKSLDNLDQDYCSIFDSMDQLLLCLEKGVTNPTELEELFGN